MNTPIKITATVDAWLTSSYNSLDKLLSAGDDPAATLSMLGFASHDMSGGAYPWTRVGTAEITVTFVSVRDAAAAQIETLNAELAQERAKWLDAQSKILERISKLQALEYVEAA